VPDGSLRRPSLISASSGDAKWNNSPVPWMVIGQLVYQYMIQYMNKRLRAKKYANLVSSLAPFGSSIVEFISDATVGQLIRTLQTISPLIIYNIAIILRAKGPEDLSMYGQ